MGGSRGMVIDHQQTLVGARRAEQALGLCHELLANTGSSPFGVRSECEAVGMGRYNM